MRINLPLAIALLLAIPTTGAAAKRVWTPKPRSESEVNVFGLPLDQVSAGLGLGNYNGDFAKDVGVGPGWNVGADLDVSGPIDLEVGYVGGINSLNGQFQSFNAYTNGVQAQLQLEPWTWNNTFSPYVSGGLGLHRISVAKDVALNQVYQSDTSGAIPLAAGFDIKIAKSLVAGARAQYDVLFDNEVIVGQSNTDSDRTTFLVKIGSRGF